MSQVQLGQEKLKVQRSYKCKELDQSSNVNTGQEGRAEFEDVARSQITEGVISYGKKVLRAGALG